MVSVKVDLTFDLRIKLSTIQFNEQVFKLREWISMHIFSITLNNTSLIIFNEYSWARRHSKKSTYKDQDSVHQHLVLIG